ncbi:hypothetical protein [Streptomyces sp. NPDC020681]|uniref:hypothetical protein n=1 Tax=Streptomyces sp. NPDC020681 TaxID=3365083 RepID=UPI0037AACB84
MVSDATDWLSATGGIVGAIGGPAGIWAAWNQHRIEKRRRSAPPAEVTDCLLKVIHTASQATFAYRDRAWFDAAGGEQANRRLSELEPAVRDERLAAHLSSVGSYYLLMARQVTRTDMDATEVAETVQDQREMARMLKQRAEEALADVKRLS